MAIQLRPHQLEAVNNVIDAILTGAGQAIGRVIIPTGGGKTFVEAAVLDYQRLNNSKTRIHLVLAPRIMLCNQLISEYRKFSGDDTYRVMAFHSGNWDDDDTKAWKETSTTRVDDILEAHKNAIKGNHDLVVFSTYHSCGKLIDIQFDTIIADESQYCVTENFNDDVKSLQADVRIFCTATERHTASNNGRGLNNENVYGKRLYVISPEELIKLGLIVPPRLHVMYGKTDDEQASIINEVVELAREQNKLTTTSLGFSKILFAMKGTDDVKTIEDNINVLRATMPNHDVFTITSKTGAQINGIKVKRQQFLDELKARTNCLVFHYDILSEGIDVDGITGVCLMRNLGLAKMLQTIGRAVRIYKPAPELKKQAWISVAVLNGDEDDKERVKFFVNAIRDGGFDISAESVVETGILRHMPEVVPVDDAYGDDKANRANGFLAEVLHEIEQDDIKEQQAQLVDRAMLAENFDETLDILFEMV